MGKKGLSEEEKLAKIKEIFTESKDVLSLKEVEKHATKDKGINGMLVKGLLQKCCDDNMVNSDKIGAGNFYWAFPGQDLQAKKTKVEVLKRDIETLKRKCESHKVKLEQLEAERGETEERKHKMAKLTELRKENESLKKELQPYADVDLVQSLDGALKTNLEAANRWTDNIFNLRSYCCNKFGMSTQDFDRNFELDELDYIE